MEVIAGLLPVVSFAVHIGLIVALVVWGRWVAKRHDGLWWRRASKLPLLGLGCELLALGVAAVMLVRSFGALNTVEPSRKAQVLAASISTAMNAGASFGVLAISFYVVSLVAFTVGTVRPPGPRSA